MSSTTTRGVRVEVRARLVPERSSPPDAWFFAYEVTIANDGEQTVQLLARTWNIRNADGRLDTVRGAGVVGEQPTLQPGQQFQYVSACPLDTPYGSMQGSYTMATEGGELFEAEIAEFALIDPMLVN